MVSYRTALGVALAAVAWAALASRVNADRAVMQVLANGDAAEKKQAEGMQCWDSKGCAAGLKCAYFLTVDSGGHALGPWTRLNLPKSVKSKRCFKQADVVTISARDAYLWRWIPDFDPSAKGFRFGKLSAAKKWRWTGDPDYLRFMCPIPDERLDQVCGPNSICHLDHQCRVVSHGDGVVIFKADDMKTTTTVDQSQCLQTVSVGVQTPKPDESMELPRLKVGAEYCLQRGLGKYCHPQLPYACGKGLYCKGGQCVEEPIPQCAHFFGCEKYNWRNARCGFPTEDFPLQGEIPHGKVCCLEETSHYQPLNKHYSIIDHGRLAFTSPDYGLEVCGDKALMCANCDGMCRNGHCVPVLKSIGERCVGDDRVTKTSRCITSCDDEIHSPCSAHGFVTKRETCQASGCFMAGDHCMERGCATTKFMPLTDATIPKLAPPNTEHCEGKCYPWLSFQEEVRKADSDSWQFATTGVLSEKCQDLSKPREVSKQHVHGSVHAVREVLRLPKGSPCIPQYPSRRDEEPHLSNYDNGCASDQNCYEMRRERTDGTKGYKGQPYLGYGCCRPRTMDDATWESSRLKTDCQLAATMDDWFVWRRVAEGVPHYHYNCIDKDDGYGHWYLYSEDNHEELVQCPQAVTTVANKRWCVLGRHWPCKEDHQCESNKCLNENNAATGKSIVRYGQIFQCA